MDIYIYKYTYQHTSNAISIYLHIHKLHLFLRITHITTLERLVICHHINLLNNNKYDLKYFKIVLRFGFLTRKILNIVAARNFKKYTQYWTNISLSIIIIYEHNQIRTL